MSRPRNGEFDLWIRLTGGERSFYVAGHRFVKSNSGQIIIDNGTFELEEAMEVGHMLVSINPVARLSAELAICEKNGTLVKVVLVAALMLLAIIVLLLIS